MKFNSIKLYRRYAGQFPANNALNQPLGDFPPGEGRELQAREQDIE